MHRALVRVVGLDDADVVVVVPGWNPNVRVSIARATIPSPIVELLEPGQRLHAQVNLGAQDASELRPSGWEPE